MKKRLLLFVLLVSLLTVPVNAAEAAPGVSAEAMIVIHSETGQVLTEKNADTRMLIASTTKIMTALVALEHVEPDREVEIDPAWAAVEGSSMYLRPGAVYTMRELLYGLMLASGNDAALAIACTVAGTPEDFAVLMNEKAQSLGLENTRFANPHGLDSEEHYSTARDMAIIMAEAMKNELFSEIVSTRSFSTHGATYVNHNKLLWRCEGVNGGKTGYTKAAGRCLVTSCEREGLSLICVTLSASSDWNDHAGLYEWAFREYDGFCCPAGETLLSVPLVSGSLEAVGVAPSEDIALCLTAGSQVDISYHLPRFAFAPVQQGDAVGTAVVSVNGKPVGEYALCWAEDAARSQTFLFTRLFDWSRHVVGVYYI